MCEKSRHGGEALVSFSTNFLRGIRLAIIVLLNPPPGGASARRIDD